MSTRSYIGITDGKDVEAIFCHWDGYLSNNGIILAAAYQNPEKVKSLISAGILDSLGAQLLPVFTPTFELSKNDFTVLTLNKVELPFDYCSMCRCDANLHFTTTYADGEEPKHFKFSTIHKDLGFHIEYIYLYHTVKKKWYVMYHSDVNAKWYDLKKLCTNKEYFEKYKAETGAYDKWIEVKTRYNNMVNQLSHPGSYLTNLNKYLHKVTKNACSIRKLGDIYRGYFVGKQESLEHEDPVLLAYTMKKMIG